MKHPTLGDVEAAFDVIEAKYLGVRICPEYMEARRTAILAAKASASTQTIPSQNFAKCALCGKSIAAHCEECRDPANKRRRFKEVAA